MAEARTGGLPGLGRRRFRDAVLMLHDLRSHCMARMPANSGVQPACMQSRRLEQHRDEPEVPERDDEAPPGRASHDV
jgi:hypothetical protein